MSEPTAPVAATTDTPTTAAQIEAWFVTHIHNSPVSRDAAIYNHVRAAVDALKAQLAPEPAPADGGE